MSVSWEGIQEYMGMDAKSTNMISDIDVSCIMMYRDPYVNLAAEINRRYHHEIAGIWASRPGPISP
jgi:hypothetical protein